MRIVNEATSLMITVTIMTLVVNISIAVYGVFTRPSLTKKIISLIMCTDSINIFAVIIGFRISVRYPSPPILPEPPDLDYLQVFVSRSVDPIPQALLVTAIVIGLATSVFLMGLSILYYKHFGTTDIRAFSEEDADEAPE
jgi:multicomponent Na+:H+ antiporter subunit C